MENVVKLQQSYITHFDIVKEKTKSINGSFFEQAIEKHYACSWS